jgi:hypothetical protein
MTRVHVEAERNTKNAAAGDLEKLAFENGLC